MKTSSFFRSRAGAGQVWLLVLSLLLFLTALNPLAAEAAKRPSARQGKIAGGGAHTLVIQADGTLWAWGTGDNGQLGQGDATGHTSPVQVGGATDWLVVAAGMGHSLGIRADGTLWSWGWNVHGQLGQGDNTTLLIPTRVGNFNDWVWVAAGNMHSLGIRADGSLWAWGSNSGGQLGQGDTIDRLNPTQVGSAQDWVAAACGASHSLGLRAGGTIWAWGFNGFGQLGQGDTGDRYSPTQVGASANWEQISGGGSFSAAIQADGTVWGWGANDHGQLSLGDTAPRYSPTNVATIFNATAIAGGGSHSLGLAANGTLWAAGYNAYGQLGLGDGTDRSLIQQVGAGDWVAFAGGLNHSVALKADGSLHVFGANNAGQLGLGDAIDRNTPVQVPGVNCGLTAATAGSAHSLGIRANGSLLAWGYNGYFQLGLGDTVIQSLIPASVGSDANWTTVAAGSAHSLGIKADGSLWAWGWNPYGQLGLGDTIDQHFPTRVGTDNDWVAVACGDIFSFGIKANGTLWAWGTNGAGQLGLGDTDSRLVPTQVGTANDWLAVATGISHTVAIRANGSLWTWGFNGNGQLGQGDTTARTLPTQVPESYGWVGVAAGDAHSLALRADGSLWGWGNNAYGQLGLGPTGDPLSPTQVVGWAGWKAIAARGNFSLGTQANGTLWAWGNNDSGQLGLGDNVSRNVPTQVTATMEAAPLMGAGAPSAWLAPVPGWDFTLGLQADGSLSAWGWNGDGQLGLGDTNNRLVPTAVPGFPTAPLYTITATAGTGGSISPAGSISLPEGGSQEFIITPDAGYRILDVVMDGTSMGPISSITIYMTNYDRTITAIFTDANNFIINASAAYGGDIYPAGPVAVPPGGSQTFTIDPNLEIYQRILDVYVDGVSQGPGTSTYTFTNVNADHYIYAEFTDQWNYVLWATNGPGGSISPYGGTAASWGGSQTFIITPDPGYHIVDVLVDGSSVGAVPSYDFSYIMADASISATFAPDPVTISATAGTGGSITPSGAVIVAYGADQSFTITPDTGYYIAGVVVDGVDQGPQISGYTFYGVTENHTITANFAPNPVITASAGPNGTITPSGAVSVAYGSPQSFTFTPNTGYHVADVLVDGSSVGAVTSYTFPSVTANHTISASFAVNTYTITATAGANGSISPAGAVIVNHAASQTFTFTPNPNYHVLSVVVDGVNQGAMSSYTFVNVQAPHTIQVNFAPDPVITATAGPNGSISPAGAVIVPMATNQTFNITPNTGYHVADVLVDGFSVGAVTSYTFVSVVTNHTISATFALNTHTITATAGANGSITPSGAVSVNDGGSQVFSITANTGYHVLDVLVDGVSVGAVTTYTFNNVTANHTIQASFALNTYTITATAGTGGSITPSGAVSVNSGASQGFTITANTGYHVLDVLVDGVSVGPVTSYTFNNVTANHTIQASFALNTFTITATAGANGSITPSGAVSVNSGASQGFTITPNTGYHVLDVLVDGVSVGPVTSYTFNNVTANHTIQASFAVNTFTINASAGANGSITPSGAVSVNYGASQTFNFTPAPNYHVLSVLVDGVNQGAMPSYTFVNVQAPHNIQVNFAPDPVITATAGPNGSITPSGAVIVPMATNQTFAITPNTGYHVADVLVDGASVGAVTSYTFVSVVTNHTISASFAPNDFIITAGAGPNGSITPAGAVNVPSGSSQTFSITANTGYHVLDVLVDGVSVGPVTSYTFNNVTANHTIQASFAINTYTITATAGAGGGITPAGAVPVDWGGGVSFTITPAPGYNIQNVVVDGVAVGPVSTYSFANVTADHTITATFVAQVIQIVVDRDRIVVPYLKTGQFQVRLSSNPQTNVAVAVSWQSGNPNIQVQNGANLIFTPANWNIPQTVTLVSTEETGMIIIEWAQFQVSAPSLEPCQVTAVWMEKMPTLAPLILLLEEDGAGQGANR